MGSILPHSIKSWSDIVTRVTMVTTLKSILITDCYWFIDLTIGGTFVVNIESQNQIKTINYMIFCA